MSASSPLTPLRPDDAPPGPKVGAFFDFDGTLIHGYSVRAFLTDGLRRNLRRPAPGGRALMAMMGELTGDGLRDGGGAPLLRVAGAALQGEEEEALVAWGERLFRGRTARFEYRDARALVRAHQRRGHTVVIASSASPYQVEPFARDLGVDHVLCTRFETEEGRLTGRIVGSVLWGPEKARAVRSFAAAHGVDLDQSFAYADGDEEQPLLASVGHPCAVNPRPGLAAAAEANGWPVLRFGTSPLALVRTGAGAVGLASATGVAIGVGAVNRSRRQAANLVSSTATDLALALAGVRLRVVGEEHVWSDRPAVFIFNHQSALDVVILGNLLRRDVTGVAKREASRDPRFALLGYLAGIAYIDRSDHAQAVAALDHAVETLRSGVSIGIAPEGTRSPTMTVGPFKKGAFHLARQAEVPVVPIVLRNTGQLMWRGSTVVHQGTVDVAVLPPIDVSVWADDDLDDQVESLRQRYVDTLDDWPTT